MGTQSEQKHLRNLYLPLVQYSTVVKHETLSKGESVGTSLTAVMVVILSMVVTVVTITGGSGGDELWGDFGLNTFKSEKDGQKDLVVIKSDHYVYNWLNNATPTIRMVSGLTLLRVSTHGSDQSDRWLQARSSFC